MPLCIYVSLSLSICVRVTESDLIVWNPLNLAVILPLIDLSQYCAGNGCIMETHQCPPFKWTDRNVGGCTELWTGQPQGLIRQPPKSKADTCKRIGRVFWHSPQEAIRGMIQVWVVKHLFLFVCILWI